MTRAAMAALALLAAGCRHPSKVGTPAETAAGPTQETKGEPSRAQKGVPPKGEHPRVPSSPKALLADGGIARIQDALARRGYLEKRSTGELDGATTAALRKFQRDERLAETGFPDRLTLQKLGIDPEAAYGKVREEKDAAERRETGEGSAGKGESK